MVDWAAIASLLLQSVWDPRRTQAPAMLSAPAAALAAVLSVAYATDVPTHYPPAPDSHLNLMWAINGTGAPGIFSSSKTPKAAYGTYNWCAMPHVRRSEYPVPPSEEYALEYLEVIQRHHKRTPYASNTFFREDIPWECIGEGPYHYARSRSGPSATPVYWQAQTGSDNPFEQTVGPGFVNSTCRFPSITSAGLDDSREHGRDFRSVYHSLLGFLPPAHERHRYAFRVTNNDITSQTLSGFAAGVYPDATEYAAWIQSATYDSLEPSFSCPYASAVNEAYEGDNPEWTAHLAASAAVGGRFDTVAGISANDTAGWHTSWDHPYDNLSAKQCHQKPLPCSVNDTALCVSQADADTIYRLGQYEYAYRWRGADNSTLYAALNMGPWFRELVSHLRAAAAGESEVRYLHNFAHDGSVSAVLGVLQIAYPVWPGMGAEVVFELWRHQKTQAHHVRILWSGQALRTSTPLGTLDMILLDDFVQYLNATIPADLVAACNQNS